MINFIEAALSESAQALNALIENKKTLQRIEEVAMAICKAVDNGGHVYSFGNGGSMCDAMHFAEEFSGRFRKNRAPIPAAAISDPSHLTCVSNDFGFDHVFSRYIEGFAKKGDVVLGISTSGSSQNVLLGLEAAKKKGAITIALTGKEDCKIASYADYLIATPGGSFSDRVQELHIKVLHILIELCERQFFPDNYN